MRNGFSCTKLLYFIFNTLLWIVGLGILAVGIWMLADPRRAYILDLVNFYERDPLLLFAAYIFLGVGCAAVVVGILGCCGALREIQCMLASYCFVLGIIFCAQMTAGIMAVVFRDQITRDMKWYLYDLAHNRYDREKWVTSLMDTIQFYQKCCGSNSSADYDMSFWQIWNNQRGAVLYVPVSCCTQTQDAYPPDHLKPIDDRCQEFPYDKVPAGAVYQQGCYQKLMAYFDENSLIFIILGFGICAFLVAGICLSICLCMNIRRRMI